MRRKTDKGRLPAFVPMFKETLATPAWRSMSHGARSLYLALKLRHVKNNGRIYLSQRDARVELGSGFEEIGNWFRELQHYGFIVMMLPGYLGIDGKGMSPHWRLTELPYLDDPPTRDFNRWNESKFKRHIRPARRAKKTESRTGNAVHLATEMRCTPATEMRSANANNCTGNAVHIAAPQCTALISAAAACVYRPAPARRAYPGCARHSLPVR
jgi:hypothetical protein